MAEVTVKQLAEQIGVPVGRLLLLLAESGAPQTNPNSPVNDEDRLHLFSHLRRVQGRRSEAAAAPARKTVLPRKSAGDPEGAVQRAVREAVTVQVRKRRTLRTPTDTPPAEEVTIEPAVVPEAAPVVTTTTTSEFEEAKRALHEEAKRRNEEVDALIRADTEAREKAELLKPKAKPGPPPKPRPATKVAAQPVSGGQSSSGPAVLSNSSAQSTGASNDEAAAKASVEPVTAALAVPERAEAQAVVAHEKSAKARESNREDSATDSEPGRDSPVGRESADGVRPQVTRKRKSRNSRRVADSASGEDAVFSASNGDAGRAAKADRGARRGVDRKDPEFTRDKPERHHDEAPKSRPDAAGGRPGFSWWSRPLQASAALRPGVLTGGYPEREDLRDSWLERTAASAAGLLRQHVGGGRPRYRHFVDQVHAAARGMDELDDAALSRLVPELRRRLYSEGFSDELVSRSFAVVREMATRRLNMRHYDVQLYGGWIMLNGMIAEMETGEGKTLTATLTAATVAMAGVPVHVVTVNDFLVQRDAAWMQPLYRALGLKVGTITEAMEPDERRKAYACDITYCTNKQLVFDYLKDRLVLGTDSRRLHMQLETLHSEVPRTRRLLLRGLCFAIVDEADSVLVDEARTPLVISKAGDTAQQEKTYRDAIRVARQLRGGRDFEVRTRERRVELSDAGKKRAALLTRELKGIWSGVRRRESLMRQALSAIHLFQAEKHYLVNDGKVQIVDEYTGRVMADRSWEGGLHQMIQAKEGLEITGQQETLARISYQRFFRRYLSVAGMTGTAHEVARELWSVYRLNVVSVPTNRAAKRTRLGDAVYVDEEHKWQAVVRDIRAQHEDHRPILVGTRSVGASEHLSELLREARLTHVVLNARQDQHEAEVVAMAGQAGRITVATNMAGRGTDIRLAPGVADNGGLHVLATERHESGRIDRQLFGRGARQGDPGSYRCLVSLEDELVSDFWPQSVLRVLRAVSAGERLPHWLGAGVVALAQRAAENNHGRTRRDLLRLDDNLGDMLAFSGRGE